MLFIKIYNNTKIVTTKSIVFLFIYEKKLQ